MLRQASDDILCRIHSNSGYVGYMDITKKVWTENNYLGRIDALDGRVYNFNDLEIGSVGENGVIISMGDVVGFVDPFCEVWSHGRRIGCGVGRNVDPRSVGGGALLLLLQRPNGGNEKERPVSGRDDPTSGEMSVSPLA